MLDYKEILNFAPYSLSKHEKEGLLTRKLTELTLFHYENCAEYKKILDCLGFNAGKINSYYDIPFLPVSIFKELDLMSIEKSDVFKTVTSSGTSGQAVSKIYLDKITAGNQQKTLAKIVSDYIGPKRIPMMIIDSPSVITDRSKFSARGAGITGFSIFGSEKTYALNDDMSININAINAFLEKHRSEDILLYGFTFIIWQHFYSKLIELNAKVDLSGGVLIHGGGWKKLNSEAVSQSEFKRRLNTAFGLLHVHDYYGMAEQAGCVCVECELGYLHASVYSDIITRHHIDFSPCDIGEAGIIQVVSILPESYPGHLLLTEDEGVILGEDNCLCGRKGKYFKINGRLKNAEIRGCSDTYAAKF